MPNGSIKRQNLEKTEKHKMPKNEPVVVVGGFMSSPRDYMFWQMQLATKYSMPSRVANVERRVWMNTRQSSYAYQINALNEAVEQVRRDTGAEKVWLVCHSAGGLVARLWMGDYSFSDAPFKGHPYVRGIVFLGSPYSSKEQHVQDGIKFANERYPGAYYPDIRYLSLVGRSVLGQANGSMLQRVAYSSYKKLNPERPNQWGDGVVTLEAAHIPNATNYSLDGIYHLDIPGQRGYGSRNVIDLWAQFISRPSNSTPLQGVA